MIENGKKTGKTHTRWALWLPVALWMVAIFTLSGISFQDERVEFFRFQDKIIHLLEFGVLGLLMVRAAYLDGSRSRRAYWWCIGLAMLYGALDELHQYYVPGRTVELADVAADGLGVFLLAWAYLASRSERLFHKRSKSEKMEFITR